jgi:hypothetical protein
MAVNSSRDIGSDPWIVVSLVEDERSAIAGATWQLAFVSWDQPHIIPRNADPYPP